MKSYRIKIGLSGSKCWKLEIKSILSQNYLLEVTDSDYVRNSFNLLFVVKLTLLFDDLVMHIFNTVSLTQIKPFNFEIFFLIYHRNLYIYNFEIEILFLYTLISSVPTKELQKMKRKMKRNKT
jgi:hypothetical protein